MTPIFIFLFVILMFSAIDIIMWIVFGMCPRGYIRTMLALVTTINIFMFLILAIWVLWEYCVPILTDIISIIWRG